MERIGLPDHQYREGDQQGGNDIKYGNPAAGFDKMKYEEKKEG